MMAVGQERLCERGSVGITDGRDLWITPLRLGLGAMIYTPKFHKYWFSHWRVNRGDTHTHGQEGDLINLLLFFLNEESRLKRVWKNERTEAGREGYYGRKELREKKSVRLIDGFVDGPGIQVYSGATLRLKTAASIRNSYTLVDPQVTDGNCRYSSTLCCVQSAGIAHA
jgi:hypothetical protein